MTQSPEIRAVVKMALFLLTILVATAVTIALLELVGAAIVLQVVGAALFVFILKMFYDIQVSQERYKDKLKEMQDTIRE